MPIDFSRRRFLAVTAAVLAFSNPAAALTEENARKLVEAAITDINKVIASGQSETAILRDFEKLFSKYADVQIMAQYALGNDGRSASNAQKRNFAEAFQGYISRKYGRRFREFEGGEIEVQSARAIRSGYEVKTRAVIPGSGAFEVTFLVSDRSGRDKIFNIFIEGVNLLLSERTEIGALLDQRKGDINQLIRDLPDLS